MYYMSCYIAVVVVVVVVVAIPKLRHYYCFHRTCRNPHPHMYVCPSEEVARNFFHSVVRRRHLQRNLRHYCSFVYAVMTNHFVNDVYRRYTLCLVVAVVVAPVVDMDRPIVADVAVAADHHRHVLVDIYRPTVSAVVVDYYFYSVVHRSSLTFRQIHLHLHSVNVHDVVYYHTSCLDVDMSMVVLGVAPDEIPGSHEMVVVVVADAEEGNHRIRRHYPIADDDRTLLHPVDDDSIDSNVDRTVVAEDVVDMVEVVDCAENWADSFYPVQLPRQLLLRVKMMPPLDRELH